jgi:hypothetical protein
MNLQGKKLSKSYDLVIVGASFAGCLAAIRMQATTPEGRVLLIDKQRYLGGRKTSSVWEKKLWGSGNFSISQDLLDFLFNSLRTLGQERSLDILQNIKAQTKVSMIYQNALKTFPIKDAVRDQGLKFIGGREGAKQWKNIWQDIFSQKDPVSLGKILKVSPKGPAATLLKSLGNYLGLSDFAKTTSDIIKASHEHCNVQEYIFSWQDIFLQVLQECENIDIKLDHQVIDASYKKTKWIIQTSKGSINSDKLVVCHSPWQLSWLEQERIPNVIHKWSMKNQPTTLVTLAKKLEKSWSGSNFLFVVSEGVKVWAYADVLHFVMPIEYHDSINAPTVAKAIRKLKRAANKLAKVCDCNFVDEHIGLSPVGQVHSIMTNSVVGDFEQKDKNNLFFCGSFYGKEFNPEKNIISSVLNFDKWLKKS